MRALLVVSWLSIATSGAAQRPPALRLGIDEASTQLRDEVALQLADWDVRLESPPRGATFAEREATARADVEESGAIAWIEHGEAESRLVVLTTAEDVLRVSPLPPRATPGWERVVALVLDGLLSTTSIAHALASPRGGEALPTRAPDAQATSSVPAPEVISSPRGWPSPLARNGWMLRVGWLVSASPRHEDGFGAYARNANTWAEINGGLRLRAGRWLTRFLRVDASAHVAKTWFDIGLEGGVDLELMAVSSTRFRMGGGVGFGVLFVGERDRGTGSLFGWTGWWASLPMEVGFDFHRRSGMFVHVGPTWTKAPYARAPGPGFMLSVEAELDLGAHR